MRRAETVAERVDYNIALSTSAGGKMPIVISLKTPEEVRDVTKALLKRKVSWITAQLEK